MLSQQTMQTFYELLLDHSARKSVELPEMNQRASKMCLVRFTLNLAKVLELTEEVVAAALLLAKRAVDSGLKISKKFLYRFDCCYSDW